MLFIGAPVPRCVYFCALARDCALGHLRLQVPVQCLQQLRLLSSDWLQVRDSEGAYNFSADVCDLRSMLLCYVAKLSLFCNTEATGFSAHAARNMHDDFFTFVASTGAGISPDPVLRFATLLPSHGPYFASEVQPLLLAALLNTVILRCASGAGTQALDLCRRLLTCDALPHTFRTQCRVVLSRILVHLGSKHSHETLQALTQHAQLQPAVCSANEAAVSLLLRDSFAHSESSQSDTGNDDSPALHVAHSALLSALCVFHGNVSVALPTVQQQLARCTQSSAMWDIAASAAHSSGALRRTVACCRSARERLCASVFSRLLEAKALIRIGDGAAAVAAATAAVSAAEGTAMSTTARHLLGVALGLSGCQSGSLQNQQESVRAVILGTLSFVLQWVLAHQCHRFHLLPLCSLFYSACAGHRTSHQRCNGPCLSLESLCSSVTRACSRSLSGYPRGC